MSDNPKKQLDDAEARIETLLKELTQLHEELYAADKRRVTFQQPEELRFRLKLVMEMCFALIDVINSQLYDYRPDVDEVKRLLDLMEKNPLTAQVGVDLVQGRWHRTARQAIKPLYDLLQLVGNHSFEDQALTLMALCELLKRVGEMAGDAEVDVLRNVTYPGERRWEDPWPEDDELEAPFTKMIAEFEADKKKRKAQEESDDSSSAS